MADGEGANVCYFEHIWRVKMGRFCDYRGFRWLPVFRSRLRARSRMAGSKASGSTAVSDSSFVLSNARKSRRAMRLQFLLFESSHSHTRTTCQPSARSVRITSQSRFLFRANFAAHHSVRVFGKGACFGFGHPCQKQPSTKTARFCCGNAKSGLPKMGRCRRQPLIPFCG